MKERFRRSYNSLHSSTPQTPSTVNPKPQKTCATFSAKARRSAVLGRNPPSL